MPRYVCGPDADNAPVLSHLYHNKQVVIIAGAKALIIEAHMALFETCGDGMFVYEKPMCIV